MATSVIATCALHTTRTNTLMVQLTKCTETNLYMVTNNGVIVGMRHDNVDDAQRVFAEAIVAVKL